MRRLVACAVLLALAAAAPGDARKRAPRKPRHPAKHRVHAPPTPRIKPGTVDPLIGGQAPFFQSAPVLQESAAPETVPSATAGGVSAPLPRTLGVAAKEFRFTLTRTTVGAGAVTIQFGNAGEDGHDLHVDALDGAPVVAWGELPAESAPVTKIVTLTAGTYRLYCSLPGHTAAGMDTRLNVA